MPGPRRLQALLATLAALVAISSCGLSEGAVGDEDTGPQPAKVVILVPGGESATGTAAGVVDSARVALEGGLGDLAGWRVEVEVIDDGPDPRSTAESIVADDVVAVIGGLSTSTVRAVQPVFDAADVIFVSPADVDPTHTRGADQNAPLRPYHSYFRTAVGGADPTDVLTGYGIGALGASQVAVVDGGDAAEAAQFATSARRQGAEVALTGATGAAGEQVTTLVAAAKAADVDAVLVSGAAEQAAAVATEIDSIGWDAAVLLGESVDREAFLDLAGAAAEGAVSVAPAELPGTVGVQPDALTAALSSTDARDPGRYGAAAFDAGTAVATVLSRCLPPASSARSAREGCLGEMDEVSFAGVTGSVAFDEYGDRLGGVTEILVASGDGWSEAHPSD